MVTLLYGYQGSGKSYHALAEYIIPWLQAGNHVYTNLTGLDPLLIYQLHSKKDKAINFTQIHQLDENQVFSFWAYAEEPNALFVIDEVQNVYGSSNFRENSQTGFREGLKQYVSLHRKRGDSVLFICQEPAMVDSVIRDLSEHWVHTKKLNFLWGGKTSQYVVNHRKGGKKGELIKSQRYSYRPKVFVCYNSTLPGVEESATVSDGISHSKLGILWAPGLALILIIGSVSYFAFSKKKTPILPSGVPNVTSSIPPRLVNADGWINDSLCVHWLSGVAEVAISCPDPGRRSGRFQCLGSSGVQDSSCLVEVLATPLAGASEGNSFDSLESASFGPPGGPPPAGGK